MEAHHHGPDGETEAQKGGEQRLGIWGSHAPLEEKPLFQKEKASFSRVVTGHLQVVFALPGGVRVGPL